MLYFTLFRWKSNTVFAFATLLALLAIPKLSQASSGDGCVRTMSNTTGCSNHTYVLYLKDKYGNAYHLDGNTATYQWIEQEDGSVRILGTGFTHSSLQGDVFTVDVLLTNPTTSPPSGSPKNNVCGSTGSTSDWIYYETTSGTITSKNRGVYTVTRKGPAFQQGTNANITQLGYGASGWINLSGCDGFFTTGDLNMMLSTSCSERTIDCERDVKNTVGCANTPYILWFKNKYNNAFHLDGDTSSYKWYKYTNGDVRVVGSGLEHPSLSNDTYDIDITFSGATTTPPSGSPKNSNCFTTGSSSGWTYYTNTLGVVRSSKHGSFVVTRMGEAFQQGEDANIIQQGYGASGWLYMHGGDGYLTQGDVNVMLSESCDEEEKECAGTNTYDPCIITYGKGSSGNYSTTINISEPISEIDEIIVEGVYKGGQPTSGSFTNGSTTDNWYSSDALSLNNVSGTSHKGYYTSTLGAASSVTMYVNNNKTNMYGFVAYVKLKDEFCADNNSSLTDDRYYVYQNTKTTTFTLPVTTNTKTITAVLPIVEMNNDTRIATFTLSAGGVSESVTINTYDLGKSMTIQTLTLNDIPGNVTSGTLEFKSPSSNGDSYVSGNAMINWYNPCDDVDPTVNKISGYTFFDRNRDTIFGGNEEDVPGVTVYLYEDSNNNGILDSGEDTPIDSLVTDADGYYEFEVPFTCSAKYADRVEYSSGMPDPNDALGAPGTSYAQYTMDSYNLIVELDGEIAQGSDYTIYLKTIETGAYAIISESTDGVNFYHNTNIPITSSTKQGYTITASRDTRFIKFDKHAINSISGYNVFGSTSTNIKDYGIFGIEFCGSDTTSYIVQTNTNTLPNEGDLTTDNIETASFTTGGNHDSLNNFGINGDVFIDGYVFNDPNSNGVKESGESGQSGVTVYLYRDLDLDGILDANESTPIDSAVSSSTGYYSFTKEFGCVYNYVTQVIESSGIVNPSNLIGEPDGNFAGYDTDTDNLIVELDGVIKDGEVYNIYLGTIESGAIAIISESTDGVNFYHNTNVPILTSSSQAYEVTASRDVRYIKFDKHEINAISGLNIFGSTFTNVYDYAVYGIEYCNALANGYYINTKESDYPAETALTTDNKETAEFDSYGQEDLNNNFGFNGEGGTGAYCGSLKITIDKNKVEGNDDLNNFPVYFDITKDALKSAANGGKIASEQGYDIQLVNATGNRLEIEIVDYTPTTGNIKFWANVDVVKANENTCLYLRHGNIDSASTNPSSSATWNQDYKAVYHFENLLDATSNDNDPTDYNTSSSAGKLGTSRYFDGNNDYLIAPNSSSLNIGGKHITLSAWVRIAGTPASDAPFAVKGPSVNQEAYMFGVDGGTNPVKINSRVTTTSGHFRDDDGSVATYQWALVHMVYDGTAGSNQKKVYINGNLAYSDNASGDILQGNDDLYIGKRVYGDNRYYKGKIDELRIACTSLSPGWIETEYNNQNSPSTFYSVETDVECIGEVPVTWLTFDAENKSPKMNELNWSTASEINNDRFEIQRRWENESEFKTIGSVRGFGNSSNIQNYQYKDYFMTPEADIVYYRLKQVDYDGTTDYSEIKVINLKEGGNTGLVANVFPVPSNKHVYVELKGSMLRNAGSPGIRIIDVQGRDVTIETDHQLNGNTLEMNVENLPTGVYVLEISVGHKAEILRLLVDHNSRN